MHHCKRKRKNTNEEQISLKKPRPTPVSAWQPVHVAGYLRACGVNDKVTTAIEKDGISGQVALKLTKTDLKGITKSLRERTHVYQSLQDLQDPLMSVFIQMDTDQSNFISAPELAHVLTRLRKRVVTNEEASAMIAAADEDQSGGVDFQEFKDILSGSSDVSCADDWASAAKAVGAPTALLNGALATRDQVEVSLKRIQSAMRSGSKFIHGKDKLKGLMVPSPGMRFVIELRSVLWMVVYFYVGSLFLEQIYDNPFVMLTFLCFFVITEVLGVGIELLFFLWSRGQTLAHWMCGTQYRSFATGKEIWFGGMLCLKLVHYLLHVLMAVLTLACLGRWSGPSSDGMTWTLLTLLSRFSFELYNIKAWTLFAIFGVAEFLCAVASSHNRSIVDKLLGHVVVYRPYSSTTECKHLYEN